MLPPNYSVWLWSPEEHNAYLSQCWGRRTLGILNCIVALCLWGRQRDLGLIPQISDLPLPGLPGPQCINSRTCLHLTFLEDLCNPWITHPEPESPQQANLCPICEELWGDRTILPASWKVTITFPDIRPRRPRSIFSLRSHSKLICFRPKSEHFVVRRITHSAGEEKHPDENDWNRTLESSIQVQLGLSLWPWASYIILHWPQEPAVVLKYIHEVRTNCWSPSPCVQPLEQRGFNLLFLSSEKQFIPVMKDDSKRAL